jgi:hypothetical protein
MRSMVVALLPMLGLNKGKDQFSGNQEAVLPHNQEAVLPHNPGIRNQEAILDQKSGSNRILAPTEFRNPRGYSTIVKMGRQLEEC